MFKKLTTIAKISLGVSVFWLIAFFFRDNYHWYDILSGYLLYASLHEIGTFLMASLDNYNSEQKVFPVGDTHSERK